MNALTWRMPDGHSTVAPATIRHVWAGVSQAPQLPVRALGAQLGLSFGQTTEALHILRDAGYIDFVRQAARARRILVPFAFVPDPLPDDGPEQDSDVDGIPMGGKRQ